MSQGRHRPSHYITAALLIGVIYIFDSYALAFNIRPSAPAVATVPPVRAVSGRGAAMNNNMRGLRAVAAYYAQHIRSVHNRYGRLPSMSASLLLSLTHRSVSSSRAPPALPRPLCRSSSIMCKSIGSSRELMGGVLCEVQYQAISRRLYSHSIFVGAGGGSSITRNESSTTSSSSSPPSAATAPPNNSMPPQERCVLLAVDCRSRRPRRRDEPTSTSTSAGGKRGGGPDAAFTFEESIDEMKELVRTAGFDVVSMCTQKLQSPNKKTYVGPGKLDDLFAAVVDSGASAVVVDADLSPRQLRALEAEMSYRIQQQQSQSSQQRGKPQSNRPGDVRVLDRTSVILDIFAKHARSKEALMQVELATLHYRLAQLSPDEELVVDETESDEEEEEEEEDEDGGGVTKKRPVQSHKLQTRRVKLGESSGFRGKGETKLELDRREVKDRIVKLKGDIAELGTQRAMHRSGRQRVGLPMVSLVGYTNAGKSTVFSRLSHEAVLCEDKLFATLDPVTRRVKLPAAKTSTSRGGNETAEPKTMNEMESVSVDELVSSESSQKPSGNMLKYRDIFLTDTVGFISKLPANLIAAFRATLEQAVDADVILHVIDRSNPSWTKQRDVVRAELASMYADITKENENPAQPAYSGGNEAKDALDNDIAAISAPVKYPKVIEVWNKMDKVCNITNTTTEGEFEEVAGKIIEESSSSSSSPAPIFPSSKQQQDWLTTPAAVIPVSALYRKGIRGLVRCVSSAVADDLIPASCYFQYDQGPNLTSPGHPGSDAGAMDVGKWTGQIYRQGEVESAEYSDSGVHIRCKLPESLYNKLVALGVVKAEE